MRIELHTFDDIYMTGKYGANGIPRAFTSLRLSVRLGQPHISFYFILLHFICNRTTRALFYIPGSIAFFKYIHIYIQ